MYLLYSSTAFQLRTEMNLGKPPVMLLNKTVNVCKMLEKKSNEPLVNIIFKEMMKSFKLPNCPFPKVYTTLDSKLGKFIIYVLNFFRELNLMLRITL